MVFAMLRIAGIMPVGLIWEDSKFVGSTEGK